MSVSETAPTTKKCPRGVRALRKTCSGFGKNFSQGTSAIADAILDKSVSEKKQKFAKVRTVSLGFMNDLLSGLKQDLKDVTFVDVMSDTSFEIGRFSAAVQNVGGKLWGQIAEKLDEDKKV